MSLTQKKYVRDLLIKTNMAEANPSPTPMCPSHKLHKGDSEAFDQISLYRSTIGSLQYLTMTRPDIAYAVNRLSRFLQSPTVKHWTARKRLLGYLTGIQHYGLHFIATPKLQLSAFSDAD